MRTQLQTIQRGLYCSALILAGASLVSASDLDLSVTSGGANEIFVSAGSNVDYAVSGVLSDNSTQGLAMFAFDLTFDGGILAQADPPLSTAMLNFATPLGLNNPAGFGGTPVGGDLIQIGGAQNTIANSFAMVPMGMVMTGVALPGSAETLVTGSLTAPVIVGSYTLSAENLFANAILATTTGSPFWEVEAANPGQIDNLIINVVDCNPSNYCTAKVNSLGCQASMGFSGSATLTGPDDFVLTASNALNEQMSLAFYGFAPGNAPHMGGTLCVTPPLLRTAIVSTGGGGVPGTACTGAPQTAISQAQMVSLGLSAGSQLYAQFFYRDPAQLDGTGLGMADGLAFMICP